ncbi:hypothetical protein CORC01_05625 [Colletotrichum orchidophilum]|uniref:Uncharacterized protein n=1 Tax=Colletotrichum orchidophilum TaxID=1209926 RepID=A0A1G4BCT4_9PEZI|nr:uncharacterized protein CORC01_05625 [Colletotrichum orchidophilum]OHE99132.1 hypothetical protein CORC01_05625 [Colletotrichum orchidophilum]
MKLPRQLQIDNDTGRVDRLVSPRRETLRFLVSPLASAISTFHARWHDVLPSLNCALDLGHQTQNVFQQHLQRSAEVRSPSASTLATQNPRATRPYYALEWLYRPFDGGEWSRRGYQTSTPAYRLLANITLIVLAFRHLYLASTTPLSWTKGPLAQARFTRIQPFSHGF